MDRKHWSRICQALRPLLKDQWHFAMNAAMGEGEAFIKLGEVEFEALIAERHARVRIIIRSYEAAISDGFILVSFGSASDVPDGGATYQQWWSWARGRKDAIFLPFDVKVLSLDLGRPGHYYNWSPTSVSSREQSEHTKLIIALVEGMHNHMALIPTGSWTASRELSYGLDTISQRAPLWLRMFLVSDASLKTTITNLVSHCVDGDGWFTNPFTSATLDQWVASLTSNPRLDPGDWVGLEDSFEAVLKLWTGVEACNGKIFFNPYSPIFIDFMLALPGVRDPIWTEHKAKDVAPEDFVIDLHPRRHVFCKYRVWQLLFIQCRDGILAIMRNHVKDAWSECETPPTDMLERHLFRDFQHALDYITRNADFAREKLAADLSTLEPQDINVGLETDLSTRSLLKLPSRDPNDDPLGELLMQLRLPTDVPEMIQRWCRRSKKGVVLGFGSGDSFGSHTLVEYDWEPEDVANYDKHGIFPFNLTDRYSPEVGQRRCILLRFQDLSPPEGGNTIGFPIAQKKEYWKYVLESPRFFIIGRLLERMPWCLLLPSGFTRLYSDGKHVEEVSDTAKAAAQGGHVIRELRADDNMLPEWKSMAVISKPYGKQFLVDDNIDLGRYVLNEDDGTIFHQLYRLFDDGEEMRTENPLLRRSQSRLFSKADYVVTVSSLMDSLWRFGLERHDVAHRGPKEKQAGLPASGSDAHNDEENDEAVSRDVATNFNPDIADDGPSEESQYPWPSAIPQEGVPVLPFNLHQSITRSAERDMPKSD